jgi:hypothetical protein
MLGPVVPQRDGPGHRHPAGALSAYTTADSPQQVTDFGKRSARPNGAPIRMALADARFDSHDNVLQWCRATYPR